MKNDKIIAIGVKKYALRKKKEFLKSLDLKKNSVLKAKLHEYWYSDSEE